MNTMIQDSQPDEHLFTLTEDIVDIIGFRQHVYEKQMKLEISKYFFRAGCVDNTTKTVKVTKDQNAQLYHLFVQKHMDTEIPTRRFYRKFRRLFVEQVQDPQQVNDAPQEPPQDQR